MNLIAIKEVYEKYENLVVVYLYMNNTPSTIVTYSSGNLDAIEPNRYLKQAAPLTRWQTSILTTFSDLFEKLRRLLLLSKDNFRVLTNSLTRMLLQ
jgi:hypothetical protein